MNKILVLLSLAALTFTGCLKGDGGWQEYQQIAPGLNIYSSASSQNRLAFEQANMAMRLGVLLAEAELQGQTDLTKVVVDKVNVKQKLFGASSTIEKTAEGNYRITFNPNYKDIDELARKGVLEIRTTGRAQLAATDAATPWTVAVGSEGFEWSYTDTGSMTSTTQTIILYDGGTTMVWNEAGTYTAQVYGVQTNYKDVAIRSNWSGHYKVTPVDASLAYSKCAGKLFDVTGNAHGPSMYAFGSSSMSTEMTYALTGGKMLRRGTFLGGVEDCKLDNMFDYDTSLYPAPDVKVEWTLSDDEKTLTQRVTYNTFIKEYVYTVN